MVLPQKTSKRKIHFGLLADFEPSSVDVNVVVVVGVDVGVGLTGVWMLFVPRPFFALHLVRLDFVSSWVLARRARAEHESNHNGTNFSNLTQIGSVSYLDLVHDCWILRCK